MPIRFTDDKMFFIPSGSNGSTTYETESGKPGVPQTSSAVMMLYGSEPDSVSFYTISGSNREMAPMLVMSSSGHIGIGTVPSDTYPLTMYAGGTFDILFTDDRENPDGGQNGVRLSFNNNGLQVTNASSSADSFVSASAFLASDPLSTSAFKGNVQLRANTKLGNDISDIHQISGSVSITGSLDINGISSKEIPIGIWDMDATQSVTIPHGLGNAVTSIRTANASIINDVQTIGYCLPYLNTSNGNIEASVVSYDATNVTIFRKASGTFDSTDFDATGSNRGTILLEYVI